MKTRTLPHFAAKLLPAIALTACVFLGNTHAQDGLKIYPITPEYNGGFAAYGGTKIEDRKAVEPPVFFASGSQAIGFVRWYVGHKLLSKDLLSDWESSKIKMEIRSPLGGGAIEVSASWRGRVDPAEMGPAVKERIEVTEEWSTVEIPVPDPTSIEGRGVSGLLLRFNKGGEYEIRNIDIVPGS